MAIPEKPPWPDFPHPKRWDNFFGDLYDFMKSRQVINGDGLTWQETASGMRPVVDLARAIVAPFPFQLINASDKSGPKVRVRLGQVQTGGTGWLTPTGMTFPGDDPAYVLTVTSSNFIIALGVNIDASTDWDGTGCDLSAVAAVPVNTSSRAYFQIGFATITDGKIASVTNVIKNSFAFLTIGKVDQTYPLTYVSEFLT